MIKVSQLKTVDEMIKLWPRMFAALQQDSPELDNSWTLQLFLRCLDDGVVFVVRNDQGFAGSCCFEQQNDSGTLVMRSIPNDKGTGIAKACLEAAKTWAKAEGYNVIKVTTTKLCGSSFRYFEKSLGFRRYSVTFTVKV